MTFPIIPVDAIGVGGVVAHILVAVQVRTVASTIPISTTVSERTVTRDDYA